MLLYCQGTTLDEIGTEIQGDITSGKKLLTTNAKYNNLKYHNTIKVEIKTYKFNKNSFNLHNFLLTLLLAFDKLLITPIMTYLNSNRDKNIKNNEIFSKDNLENNVKLLTGLDNYLEGCTGPAHEIWTNYYQKIFKLLRQCIRLHHVLVHQAENNLYKLDKPELYTFSELLAEIEPVSSNKYPGGLAELGVLKIYVKLLWMYTYYMSKIDKRMLEDDNQKLKSCNIRWDVLDNNFKELGCGNDKLNIVAETIKTSIDKTGFCRFEQFVRLMDHCDSSNNYWIMDKYSGRIYHGKGKDNNLNNLYNCINLNKADPMNPGDQVKDSLFADCADLQDALQKGLYKGLGDKNNITRECVIYLMFIIIAFCMDTGLNIYDITVDNLKINIDSIFSYIFIRK